MSSFQFNSSLKLRKTLGRFDAVVEIIELAIRELKSKIGRTDNFANCLNHLCSEHGIQVNQFDREGVSNRAGHFYIVSVYQQFESYTDSLRQEFPGEWDSRNHGESLTDWFFRVLPFSSKELNADIPNEPSKLRQTIIEHYRIVRNIFAHGVEESKLEDTHTLLQEQEVEIKRLYSTAAPSLYRQINFEDFVLFTKTAKDLAARINVLVEPTPEDVVESLFWLDENPDSEVFLSRMKRFSNNESRLKKSLRELLKSQFGLIASDAVPVIDHLLNENDGPLAQR